MWKKFRDASTDIAIVGVTSLLFLGFWGRAINSQAAYRLSPVPILGPAVDSLRAFTNQGYDVAGED